MQEGMIAFLFAVGTVTLAEMGDKTQLLAMAFATRIAWWKVLIGVFAATVLNHALAVALGNFLGRIESLHVIIQAVASASFILFGLWTLKGDKEDGEDRKTSRFGAVATVAVAFFIAEVGDKTQLATIALATRYAADPVSVLMGTTAGMVMADGFGILVGVVLCRKIPGRIIKIVSASLFMVFGVFYTQELFRDEMAMALLPRMIFTAALVLGAGFPSIFLLRRTGSSAVAGDSVKKACAEKVAFEAVSEAVAIEDGDR